ncbi:MAG: hypothetical protein CM15mP115_12070 [Alphaproteobacteria bacterium]|nr:MAG: hypothetical protein CM15mP115_12070 [Alphaproteobacteria bacterium]
MDEVINFPTPSNERPKLNRSEQALVHFKMGIKPTPNG